MRLIRASFAVALLGCAGCGSSWQPAVQIDPGEHTACPGAVVFDNGDALLVFGDQSTVFARRYAHDADSWDAPVALGDTDPITACPFVAADATGHALVAWNAPPSTPSGGVVTRSFSPSSGWADAIPLAGADGSIAALQMTPDGQAVLVLQSDALTARVYEPDRGWSDALEIVAAGENMQVPPQFATARVGSSVRLAVTWDRLMGADHVGMSRLMDYDLSTHQASVNAPEVFSTEGWLINAHVVGIDGAGAVLVAWEGWDGSSPMNVFWRRRDAGVWSDAIGVGSAEQALSPTLAVDVDGDAVLAWRQCDAACNQSVIVKRRYVSGAWSATEPVGAGVFGRVALRNGRRLLGWNDDAQVALASVAPLDSTATTAQIVSPSEMGYWHDLSTIALGSDGTAVVTWLRNQVQSPRPPGRPMVLFAAIHRGR